MFSSEVLSLVLHFLSLILILFILRPENQFDFFIRLLIITACSHAVAIFTNVETPYGLLYGPCIYLAHKCNYQRLHPKVALFHIVPFLILFGIYLVLQCATLFSVNWEGSGRLYHVLYLGLKIISLLSYSLLIFYQNSKIPACETNRIFIGQLSVFSFVTALLLGLAFVEVIVGEYDSFGFSVYLVVDLLLGAAIILMTNFLYRKRLSSYVETVDIIKAVDNDNPQLEEDNRYQEFKLNEQTLLVYEDRIHSFLSESEIYLNTNVSLDLLSQEMQIPKHHISQLFNVHIGKNFYQVIADYRIAYAINRMKENTEITVESLAYECGFNSKTSFNRYFKNKMEVTPSEYRSTIQEVEYTC